MIDLSGGLNKRVPVIIIVQARLQSQRFPKKVLYPLNGVPMILHVLLRACLVGDMLNAPVVLAVPRGEEEVFRGLAGHPFVVPHAGFRWRVYGGSPNHVLHRVYMAAESELESSVWDVVVGPNESKRVLVMRLTGDCPFLDPSQCARVASVAQTIVDNTDESDDNASGVFVSNTCPGVDGLDCEVVSFRDLSKLDEAVTSYVNDDKERDSKAYADWLYWSEHVMAFFYQFQNPTSRKSDVTLRWWGKQSVAYQHVPVFVEQAGRIKVSIDTRAEAQWADRVMRMLRIGIGDNQPQPRFWSPSDMAFAYTLRAAQTVRRSWWRS